MHYSRCKVCKHPQVEEIERLFIDWEPRTRIARRFKGISADAIERHVQAAQLSSQRDDNYLRGLDRMISEAHIRGVKIMTETGLIQAYKLKAGTKGDLIQKHEHSGDISIKSDDELAERSNAIKRRALTIAAAGIAPGA